MNESKSESLQVFSNKENFELAQRIATALLKSSLVPKDYQNNLPNTLIALEMAGRIGASPLMVMQHLHVIQGRPSWSSTFLISAINNCGRFESLRFRISGSGDTLSCVAYTKDRDGNILEGPEITMKMAKAEGWLDKPGSKWKTMPELMIRYRAAAFWSRLYAPEVTMGMQTMEEEKDATVNVSNGSRFEDEPVTAEVIETVMNTIPVEPVAVEVEPKKAEAVPAAKAAPKQKEQPKEVIPPKPEPKPYPTLEEQMLPGRPFDEPEEEDQITQLFDMSKVRKSE